jgi:hypothetical protein
VLIYFLRKTYIKASGAPREHPPITTDHHPSTDPLTHRPSHLSHISPPRHLLHSQAQPLHIFGAITIARSVGAAYLRSILSSVFLLVSLTSMDCTWRGFTLIILSRASIRPFPFENCGIPSQQLGGPAQIPIAKSPRSQKECVNSNSSENDRSLTDDGQDTHHKNGVRPIDPSSHHHNVLHCTLHPTL